ncbi:MAG: hypothetical protein JXR70_19280 [Spirochaetales bacterium]|nr:hypothetical protein [Spirochaetales bacterium]
MRKLIIFLLLLTSLISLSAQEEYREVPFLPVLPDVMGMGGANVATAGGYNALFYNPAGFAMGKDSLTLLSANPWFYINPAAAASIKDEASAATVINQQLTEGGLGIGASLGLGLVTGGLGIGGAVVLDGSLYGHRNFMDASGDMTITFGFVGGYALKLNLLGMKVALGADLKPMYRVHAELTNELAVQAMSDILRGDMGAVQEMINQAGALCGVGIGIDLGAIAELSIFKFGLVIQDFANTGFNYVRKPFSEVLQGGGEEVTDRYYIPMNVSIGGAIDIPLGPLESIIDPTVQADLRDVVGVIVDGRSPWTLLHIGAEANLFKFLNPLISTQIRAGFNQGYLTFGLGGHLLFMDLNMAVFTRELGKHIGDKPNSGFTLELAFRL